MSTPHNNANIGDIAKNVIMPGDPNRAKFIAENYLENYSLVNDVRGMLAFTGFYKGTELTVMSHGMGMPSIGIYCYELFKFYDVENIIRIGSCGASTPDLDLFDLVLSKECFSESNFALTMNSENCHLVSSSEDLNKKIIDTSKKLGIKLTVGNTISSDVFDEYILDINSYLSRIPKNFNPLSSEMEAFALFYIAKIFGKKASCIMTVVDSIYKDSHLNANDRETGLNNMIKLALESFIV